MLSLGSLAGAGTLGILIPPSITMVIYAVAANVSIIQLFLAGFLPGMMVMGLYSGYIALWSVINKHKMPPPEPQMTFREKLRESVNLIPLALLIMLVFAALLLGWATATECAAWGVLGSLAIAWWGGGLNRKAFWESVMGTTRVTCMIMLILAGAAFMKQSMGYTGIPTALAAWVDALGLGPYALIAAWGGSLTRANFWSSLMGATRISCMIMFILAGAAFLTKTMAFTGIPRDLANWVNSLGLSPYTLIAVLAFIYLILGTALDGISMIVLTSAVVLPMIQLAGFDLIWFGIFVVLLVEIAEVTPPVGFNLFVLQNMTGRDSNTIARAAIPFFLMLVLAIAIVTLFPAIVTWLPDAVMGRDR